MADLPTLVELAEQLDVQSFLLANVPADRAAYYVLAGTSQYCTVSGCMLFCSTNRRVVLGYGSLVDI